MNSNFLKGFVELGVDVIHVLDEIVDHTNALLDAFVILGAYIGITFRKQIKGVAEDIIAKLVAIGAEAQLAGAASTEMSASMAGLQTVALKLGPVALAIAAVTAALVIGAKAWDKYQTTVKEWQDKISETKDKVSSLKSEIEQLQSIDYRTQAEQDRLELLKSELDYQERLLEVEKKRIAQQKYGYSTFGEAWDKDNANNVMHEDEMKRGRAGLGTVHDASLLPMGYNSGVVLQAAIDLEEYDEQLRTLDKDSEEYTKTLEQKEKAELKASDSLEQLYIDTADYQQKVQEAKEAQEQLVEGSDAWTNAQNLIDTYTKWIDENEKAIERFQKITGTFDYTSVISSMFQHTEFDGLQEKLVKLAQEGGLSVDYLTEHFSGPGGLLEQLELAGVDAEVLYQWLLRISGLVDTKNLASKIAGALGKKTYDDKGFEIDPTGRIENYLNSLSEEDRKIAAGLDIDWSTFDAEQAIRKMQSEIDKAKNNPVEVDVKSNIADSVTGINTRLKAQFDELGTLYDKIFNGEEGFDLSEIDNSDLQGIVDNFTKFNEELGLTAEEQDHVKDVAEDFMRVLTSESSTAEDVQNEFNKIATAYFYAADGQKEINEQTAAAIKQQLEQMGIMNADDVVAYYQTLANGEEVAAQKGYELSTITADEISNLILEGKVAPAVGQALAVLAIQKKLAAGVNFSESSNIAELEALAKAAGITGSIMADLARAKTLVGLAESGKASAGELSELTVLQDKIKSHDYTQDFNIDFSKIGGGSGSAGSAGSDAGDAYVEAFEKELEALEKQRDAGLISESQFLDKYRELIEKYFKDVDGYGEEYAERMADYWDRLISHMESVVSAIGTLLDKRKEAAEQGKEVAIKALEEEQKAAESNYQSQIDYIDGLIDALEDEKDALQDQIDVLNDQIDAINDANTAREHSMALQKAQYELERSMSQRTKLVYTGEVGQMRYERDESAVRSAQEDVRDAEDQLAIDAIEKQIKLLEEQQDLIDKQIQAYKDQQEALQDMLDKSNEYYESLIEQTETYWDSLIEAIDNQKSKWDELVEQKEIAEAFALVQDAMRSLGFTVEDVLNDTPGAFEAFRDAYLNALSDANSNNQDFLDGLQYATNGAKDAFGEISNSAGDIKNALGEVADATTPLSTASENIKSVGSAASTASEGVGKLNDATSGIADNVSELNNANFNGLEKAIDGVKKNLEEITKALTGPEGSVQSAIDKLNDPATLSKLSEAFTGLSGSIGQVASALGVGGGSGNGDDPAATQSAGMDESAGKSAGAGIGLAKAIEEIKNAADTFIGMSAEDESETTIGRFNLLKSAIQTIINEVLGNSEVEGTLLGNINSLFEVTNTALYGGEGGEGAIHAFDEFRESIAACAEAAGNLMLLIQQLENMSLPTFEGGEGGEGQNYTGTANYDGDWRVGKNEKSLVGELGPELVLRNGKAITVGKDGPEFVNLKKDDIVLNHLQTKAILDKKNQIRALADGSVLSPISSAMSETQAKLKGLVNGMLPTVGNIRDIVSDQTREIQRTIENISKVSTSPNITITNPSFTVSGVTGEEVMRKIEGSFEGLMLNAYQKALS